jgi:hypothetical protein
VAAFEDQPETIKVLAAAATTGQFDHVAQRARDDRDEAATRATLVTDLTATGLTLIDRPAPGSPAEQLDHLTDDEATHEPIGPDAHAACPGHAAYLVQRWIRVDGPRRGPRRRGRALRRGRGLPRGVGLGAGLRLHRPGRARPPATVAGPRRRARPHPRRRQDRRAARGRPGTAA